jgi:hypothetical protein
MSITQPTVLDLGRTEDDHQFFYPVNTLPCRKNSNK